MLVKTKEGTTLKKSELDQFISKLSKNEDLLNLSEVLYLLDFYSSKFQLDDLITYLDSRKPISIIDDKPFIERIHLLYVIDFLDNWHNPKLKQAYLKDNQNSQDDYLEFIEIEAKVLVIQMIKNERFNIEPYYNSIIIKKNDGLINALLKIILKSKNIWLLDHVARGIEPTQVFSA